MKTDPKQTLILPRQENITNQQVTTLLGIFHSMVGPLINANIPDSDVPKLDGGVKAGMETVAMNACDRLNDIISDKSRWDGCGVRALETELTQFYKNQGALSAEQYKLALEVQTPHYRFKPTIIRLEGGLWAAILGDVSSGLIGVGDCPAEAIHNFDLIFKGELPSLVIEWLHKHEEALAAGIQSPPFPTDETENVDGTGTNPTENPEGGRTDEPPNSGADGA